MCKKIISIVLSLSLCPAAVFAAEPEGGERSVIEVVSRNYEIQVSVGNETIRFTDAKPFIDENSRTQMPVRAVSESIGMKVEYDDAAREVKVSGNDTEVVLAIGSSEMTVNGNTVTMDTAARIVNDRTYIPIRFVAEALGFDVVWKDNILTVATNAAYAPFEFVLGGVTDGIDIEIARRIAEKLGMELKIQDMEFEGLVAAVDMGKADMSIAGMTITPFRQRFVDFSEPYYDFTHVILTKDGSGIRSAADLADKRTGVLSSIAKFDLTDVLKIPSDNVREYQNAEAVVSDIENGVIDAAVIDSYAGKAIAAISGLVCVEDETAFETERYAIAVKKGSELLERINSIIEEMKQSGEIEEIAVRYNMANFG